MALLISALGETDRTEWDALVRAYKEFYKTPLPPCAYDETWRRLLAGDGIFGVGARIGGEIVGIAHYLFHTTVWANKVCYLQDLFVAPQARRSGVGRALIETVAAAAREAGATAYYWLTQQDNATARSLYDRVGQFNGFVRYNFPLQ
jgi:GNAT superfamily N-acetyltransferase